MGDGMNSLRVALSLLTVIPAGKVDYSVGAIGRSGKWFPVVGLLIGLILWALGHLMIGHLPPILAGGLIVAFWAAITGGLHLDGLADCGDALPAAVSRERRLEIMKDPRLGAFGTIALVLFLILKVGATASLTGPRLFALILAPVIARWLSLLVALQPTARPDGMGADFAGGLHRWNLLIAAILPLSLTVYGGWRAVAAVLIAHLVVFSLIYIARSRLGGVTGDVHGLAIEMGELTTLIVYSVK